MGDKNPKTFADLFFGEGASKQLSEKMKQVYRDTAAREERDAWEKFAAAAMASGQFGMVDFAAGAADGMLKQWKLRFRPPPSTKPGLVVDDDGAEEGGA